MERREAIDQVWEQKDLSPIIYCPPGGQGFRDSRRGFSAGLRRRGIDHGMIRQVHRSGRRSWPSNAARLAYYRDLWRRSLPVVLESALLPDLSRFRADIARSRQLLERVRASGSAKEWLAREPYAGRLRNRFELTCAVIDPQDARELQKIYARAVDQGRRDPQDLYIKVNYLSLDEADDSLRLRFSFGEERLADGSGWARRRRASQAGAELAQAIFPESRLLVENRPLLRRLERIIGHRVRFPERIIYSNTPNGGAFFHHDYVPTQVGVIFAQLYGVTGWLVCPRHQLIEALIDFLSTPQFHRLLEPRLSRTQRTYFQRLADGTLSFADELESEDENPLSDLINRQAGFTGHLIGRGALRILRPGDVILLPAPRLETATWHSVFCLDRGAGLSLSFAMCREKPHSRFIS